MCHRPYEPSSKSEHELLEEALGRPSVQNHEWCHDGRVILAAARKHLATLARPQKVKRWVVIYPSGKKLFSAGPYSSEREARCQWGEVSGTQFLEIEVTEMVKP